MFADKEAERISSKERRSALHQYKQEELAKQKLAEKLKKKNAPAISTITPHVAAAPVAAGYDAEPIHYASRSAQQVVRAQAAYGPYRTR